MAMRLGQSMARRTRRVRSVSRLDFSGPPPSVSPDIPIVPAAATTVTTRRPTANTSDFSHVRFKSTSVAVANELGPSKHLNLISTALQKILEEKNGKGEVDIPAEFDEKVDIVEKSWAIFEKSLLNAKSCVTDVAVNETPEHLNAEVETAEQAISVAQAVYLDVLEVAREVQVPLSSERQEEALNIRKLRNKLNDILENLDEVEQEKPAA